MRDSLVPVRETAIDTDPGKPAVFGRVLAGAPREFFVNVADGADARFSCGVWQCTTGIVAMEDWPYDEFCVLLSGRVVITPRGGVPQEYGKGDAFLIPRGFTGTWDVRETIRKYYAIQKKPAGIGERIRGAMKRVKEGLLPPP